MRKFNSLYREYRPKSFDEVIGQDHITKTLINQVESGRISHAYLLCGTRGTGKTSVAKIFAQAVNCLTPVNGSPCENCANCKALLGSSNFDILEIDAASNNSVDQVRELKETIQFSPAIGKYKVYIIDEVHMLSTSAYNALLKTLEEPPKHAIFILATTEPFKLPATILSRCMKFDFKLVPTKIIKEHLKGILKKEKVLFQEEALMAIAMAGEGSVRDALSITDTLISFCNGDIKYEDVIEFLGVSDPQKVYSLVHFMLLSDYAGMLRVFKELINAGKNVYSLHNEIIKMLSNLIYVKNCVNAKLELGLIDDLYIKLSEISMSIENENIIQALNIISNVEGDLRYSRQQDVVLEAALMKAADKASNLDVFGLTYRVKRIEEEVKKNANVRQAVEPITFDGKVIWANVCKWIKDTGRLTLYSTAVSIDANSVIFEDGILNIYVNQVGKHTILSSKDNQKAVIGYLNKNYPMVIKLKYHLIKKESDIIEREIKILKEKLGDDIVNVMPN